MVHTPITISSAASHTVVVVGFITTSLTHIDPSDLAYADLTVIQVKFNSNIIRIDSLICAYIYLNSAISTI